MFSECGACLCVSKAWIRRLKKMYTETIRSKAAKMTNRMKAFFRMGMVIVTTKICTCKIAFRKRCFQVLKATKSGQQADKILTVCLTKT